MSPADFIVAVAPGAQSCAASSGIPASFTIAQAALESGWGISKTSQNAHNLFNIKADSSWHGPTWSMPSIEVIDGKTQVVPAVWRMYQDWQACFADRAAFFKDNPRYADCFKQTTGYEWARAVAAAGYATDPQYADKLCATIAAHSLVNYD